QLLKALPFDISPQGDPGTSTRGESKVHPTVVIEVENCYASISLITSGQWKLRDELALPGVLQNCCDSAPASHRDIHRTVVVVVGSDRCRVGARDGCSSSGSHIGEGAISIVAPQPVAWHRRTRQIHLVAVLFSEQCASWRRQLLFHKFLRPL